MLYLFMLMVEIFYCTFWVSAISVVWFCTDWIIHYCHLVNIAKITITNYEIYIKENPDKYFPDFLFTKSLNINNRFVKFLFKLLSCPFCLMFWLSLLSSLLVANISITAPVYILSLFILLQIKKMH